MTSVQFSRSVVSDSLQPHELQHCRPPCPSPTPGVHSNSYPSSQWCHPSSVILFSSCPQSLPASGSFPMSQLFSWGGRSIRVSALASVLPMNTQGWSPLEWTGWISLQSKGLSRVFSNTTVQKHQFFSAQLFSQSNSHPYMTTGKTITLTRQTFVGKVMSLLLNMLSRLVITFLPRSKHLLISWLQSPLNDIGCINCAHYYSPIQITSVKYHIHSSHTMKYIAILWNDKEYSNYHIIVLMSHGSKVMLKISKLYFNSPWIGTSRCSNWI